MNARWKNSWSRKTEFLKIKIDFNLEIIFKNRNLLHIRLHHGKDGEEIMFETTEELLKLWKTCGKVVEEWGRNPLIPEEVVDSF